MKLLIIGIVFLALSVAGVSTYLIRSFSGEKNIEGLQQEAAAETFVLVAARTLRPGEKVTDGSVQWQGWSKDALNEKFIVVDSKEDGEQRIKDFIGGIASSLINQGEPILADKVFKSERSAFMSGKLSRGMRAVSFTVTPQTAVAGFILPGNRVDILMSHTIKWKKQRADKDGAGKKSRSAVRELAKNDTRMTETILQDVEVLAINQLVDLVEGNALPAATVTLEVTPKQAELLITARSIGKLSMVLRSLKAPKDGDAPMGYTVDMDVSPFFRQYSATKRASGQRLSGTGKTRRPVRRKSMNKTSLKIFRGQSGADAAEAKK
jgi:pilus assembly protein CpaB